MSEFIVSARKYRPVEWADVVGQQHITDTLNKSVEQDKLAHAYLFCGPRGVGKTTCARIFARKINQHDGASPDEDFAFNVFELDAASNNSVEDIRNLTDQVRIPPQKGSHKVYIIDEVHMLSTQAFNAFLKTLEEPPKHAIFVLATTEKHKILPTILSRCQIYDFNRIGIRDMANHLKSIAEKENVNYDEDGLMAIARKADGALRDALSIFDQVVSFSDGNVTYQSVASNLGILDIDLFFDVAEFANNEDIHGTVLKFHEVINKGYDPHQFLIGLAEHYRNLLLAGNAETIKLIETGDDTRARYQEQLKSMNSAHIMRHLELLGQADGNYRASRNKRLLAELTLMQLCSVKQHEKKKSSNDRILIIPPNGIPISKPQKAETEKVAEPVSETAVDTAVVEDVKKQYGQQNQQKRVAKPAFSISKAITKKESSSDSEINEHDIHSKPKDHVDQDKLLKVWKQFANKMKNDGKISFFSTLVQRRPEIMNNVISFTINNAVQEEDLNLYKSELLEFLRTNLNNFHLQLNWELQVSNDEAHLYTPLDKFNKMVEKNPDLNTLRQTFDLDIDF